MEAIPHGSGPCGIGIERMRSGKRHGISVQTRPIAGFVSQPDRRTLRVPGIIGRNAEDALFDEGVRCTKIIERRWLVFVFDSWQSPPIQASDKTWSCDCGR